jgi:hypothetical protein
MKPILSERNIVVVLFVMVLIIFSLAQEDSKKMESMYAGAGNQISAKLVAEHTILKPAEPAPSAE